MSLPNISTRQGRSKFRRNIIIYTVLAGFILAGFVLPEARIIPVRGANVSDWNADTFWYEPWGRSGVHKGIDIFADRHTAVISTNAGMVLYQGRLGIGGNVVLVLGPKWRLHYYAHLESIDVHVGELLSATEKLGTLGTSGNARGKAPHLHYSIITLLPYFWQIDSATQGWKKMFFLDPGEYLKKQ